MKQQPAVPNEDEGGKEDGTTDRLMTASDAVDAASDEEGSDTENTRGKKRKTD